VQLQLATMTLTIVCHVQHGFTCLCQVKQNVCHVLVLTHLKLELQSAMMGNVISACTESKRFPEKQKKIVHIAHLGNIN
jgi:hypothetical protein